MMAKHSVERWKSSTPPFFKKIAYYGKIAMAVGILGGAVVGSLVTAGVGVPAFVPIALTAITSLGLATERVANLASDDPEVTKKQYESTGANTGNQ